MGQCAAVGYAPGAVADNSTLSTLFASCVRAVRADYCGDGVPHTALRNGTTINVYDNLNVVARRTLPRSVEPGGRLEARRRTLRRRRRGARRRVCTREIPSCGADEPHGVVTRVGP